MAFKRKFKDRLRSFIHGSIAAGMLAGIATLPLEALVSKARATRITVIKNGPIYTIQGGVDAAAPGDTVFVEEAHAPSDSTIANPYRGGLTLIGPQDNNKTIIGEQNGFLSPTMGPKNIAGENIVVNSYNVSGTILKGFFITGYDDVLDRYVSTGIYDHSDSGDPDLGLTLENCIIFHINGNGIQSENAALMGRGIRVFHWKD